MGCAEGIVRFLVFGVNFLFSLAGLALVVVGVLYKLNLNHFTDAIPSDYQSIALVPILVIIIGSIIFLISFFGCCGAAKGSTCLLTIYSVILILIFLCQVAIGVFVFLEVKDEAALKEKLSGTINTLFNNYQTRPESKELVDLIQTDFKCCGPKGPAFWPTPPDSCKENGKVFPDGCSEVFLNFIQNCIRVIGITVLSLSAIEIICAFFSLCLANSIRNRHRRGLY